MQSSHKTFHNALIITTLLLWTSFGETAPLNPTPPAENYSSIHATNRHAKPASHSEEVNRDDKTSASQGVEKKSSSYADVGMVADAPVETPNVDVLDSSNGDEKEEPKSTVHRSVRHKGKNHRSSGSDTTRCGQRSESELKDMLGPAFNGRYMSVDKPVEEGAILWEPSQAEDIMADGTEGPGRRVLPFHVDPDYKRELPPDFFLDISWYQEVIQNLPDSVAKFLRKIRSVAVPGSQKANTLPWQCESEIVWTDLGANYYPRFLRSIRCTKENCWFGHFKCRPKAFTVNVLKRVRDSCKDGEVSGVPEWIYEERAVTFCCECVEY